MASGDDLPRSFIAGAINTEQSQAETMRQLRNAGFKFSDATFRSLWGEIRNAVALRGTIAEANINRRPLGSEISPIQGKKSGGYLYRFDVFVRQRGEREVLRTHVGVRSERLITYRTAMSIIADRFADNDEIYDRELLSITPAAVNEFV